jgi:hypothetical protein
MQLRILQSCLLMTLTGCAATTASSSLLDSLAKDLRAMRELPMGTPTNAMCPSNAESLLGLSKTQLQNALGDPDFIDRSATTWSYSFTSPLPPDQFGGGHPELIFTFGPAERAIHVSCHYSR